MVWRLIPGLGRMYEASASGLVRSLRYKKPLKFKTNKFGYLYAIVFYDGKTHTLTLHRALALTFIPNPDNKPQVNHIDGNKLNNALSNLEWATAKENIAHARDKLGAYRGMRNGKNKLSEDTVRHIFARYREGGITLTSLAGEYGVQAPCISKIVQGRTWKHLQLS